MKSTLKAHASTPNYRHSLITRERTEKLALLNHLITNLAHVIVVCGPEGVGKSRLLNGFEEAAMESWMFCRVVGDSKLNLEKIKALISETVAQNLPDLKVQSLENAFDLMAGWGRKLVLVIDDAGHLTPGLIDKIITYSERKPVLRVILALTHSELYLKNGTDPGVDNCYQIEIPPLSEKQCGEFLEYLSTLPKPQIPFNAINESMVAEIYRESHGIPGAILANLPSADGGNKMDFSKVILISAVVGLIGLALGVQWWSAKPKQNPPVPVPVVAKQINKPKVHQPLEKPTIPQTTNQPQAVIVAPTLTPQLPKEPPVTEQKIYPGRIDIVRNDVVNDSRSQISNRQELQQDGSGLEAPAPDTVNKMSDQSQAGDESQITQDIAEPDEVSTVAVLPTEQGGQWLLGQPVENYTLQLMALSKEQDIIAVIQKNQALGQNLKYLKAKTKSGKNRFVLFYGSFSSFEQASLEAKNLPKELQKAWKRKIGAVQSEINITGPAPVLP